MWRHKESPKNVEEFDNSCEVIIIILSGYVKPIVAGKDPVSLLTWKIQSSWVD